MKYLFLIVLVVSAGVFWLQGTKNADHLADSRVASIQAKTKGGEFSSIRRMAYLLVKASCEQNAVRAALSMNLDQCMNNINMKHKLCESSAFSGMSDVAKDYDKDTLENALLEFNSCVFEIRL